MATAWRFEMDGPDRLVLAGELVIAAGPTDVFALEARNGSVVWSVVVFADDYPAISIDGGLVRYWTPDDSFVWRLADGEPVAIDPGPSPDSGDELNHQPIPTSGAIDGHALDVHLTGWTFQTPEGAEWRFVVREPGWDEGPVITAGSWFIFGSSEGAVCAVDVSDPDVAGSMAILGATTGNAAPMSTPRRRWIGRGRP